METPATTTKIDRGSTDSTAIYQEGTDLVYERTFDAPRDLVWRALTERDLIERWWGRAGSSTTVEEWDLRPGGRWRYVTRDRDGNDYTFYGEILEVEPPSKIKWTFMFDVEGLGPQGGPETMTLEEMDGRTQMRAVSHFPSSEAIDAALATGMSEGAVETWDRLEALLAEEQAQA
ncbi:MAG TPA: SRPBCC family protein [Candidatus Limnocylindria bacterium]|nr:SRPBCC family protein [Candidatus Limnocylindria bacterium]